LELLNGGSSPFLTPGIETADPVSAHTLVANDSVLNVYRWNLIRDADPVGNTVYYLWDDEHQLFGAGADGHSGVPVSGVQYLVDIFDTSSQAPNLDLSAVDPAVGSFAHHVHFTWTLPSYPTYPLDLHGYGLGHNVAPYAYSPIWKALPVAELGTVDVTGATWLGSTRELVREYQLGYGFNDTQTRSYLTSIATVGDCDSNGSILEGVSGTIAAASVSACVTKEGSNGPPPTTFAYTGITSTAPAPAPTVLSKTAAYGSPMAADMLVDLNGDSVAELVSGLGGFSNTQCLTDCIKSPTNFGEDLASYASFGIYFPLDCSHITACFTSGSISGPSQNGNGVFKAFNTTNNLWSIQANDGMWPVSVLADWESTGRNQFLELVPFGSTVFTNANALGVDLDQFADPAGNGGSSVQMQEIGLPTSGKNALLYDLGYNGGPGSVVGYNGKATGWFSPANAIDLHGDGLPDMGFIPVTTPPTHAGTGE